MKRGFTLVEVLIALTIVMVGILGLAVLMPHALRMTRDSSEVSLATQEASSIVAWMRAMGYLAFQQEPEPDLTSLWLLIDKSSWSLIDKSGAGYRPYEDPAVKILYQQSAAADLYGTVVVEVPLSNGRTESFLTYLAR